MAKHNLLGKLGEDAAAEYLIKKGACVNLLNKKVSKSQIAKIFGVGRTTLYRFIKQHIGERLL